MDVKIPDESAILDGDLHVPQECSGLVIFAHGSGSGRFPGATHLFEEPGALEEVERLAIDWVRRYLPRAAGHHGAVEMLDGVGPGEQ